jgi:hypothetical protein
MTKYGFKYGLKAKIWTKYGVKNSNFKELNLYFTFKIPQTSIFCSQLQIKYISIEIFWITISTKFCKFYTEKIPFTS